MSLGPKYSRKLGQRARVLAGTIMTIALVTPLSAQSREVSGEGPGHAFTLNPFFVLAGWISGEYEQRINSSVTFGGGASYVDFSDYRYTSFDLKVRLYPNDHAMRGFEMGMGLGVTSVDTDTDRNNCNNGPCGTSEKTKVTTPAVSIEFGHQWTLGNNRRTILVLGGGGKRYLISRKELHDDLPRVIPFFRVGIGYAW
jgi:hypothetical protein